jgi:uncharacterized membrane protein
MVAGFCTRGGSLKVRGAWASAGLACLMFWVFVLFHMVAYEWGFQPMLGFLISLAAILAMILLMVEGWKCSSQK